jgi:hypothetical protein
MAPNSSSADQVSRDDNHVDSLTVKDYLESAADASRRTRFITIAMIVASVLVLVSVLNSWDQGWISLRLNALQRKKLYAVRQFPLVCECDESIDRAICGKLEPQDKEDVKNVIAEITAIKSDLSNLGTKDEIRRKELDKKKQSICKEEEERLRMFTEALVKSAAETKYTVHVPFFGVAFDINDVGILGGVALLAVLVLLRLSLRSQIVSLRVGFKKAFACNQEEDFYDILAARQVFTFPPLRHPEQQVIPMQGWIERLWRSSKVREGYQQLLQRLFRPLKKQGRWIEDYLRKKEEQIRNTEASVIGENPNEAVVSNELNPPSRSQDEWHANRNTALRVIPHFLSLLPGFVYFFQFYNDIQSSHYGFELAKARTWLLLSFEGFLQLLIFIFGLWCITKWNEVDKLWDYFDQYVREKRKLGKVPQGQVS